MSLWDHIKAHRPISCAAIFCLAADTLDIISSTLCSRVTTVEEMNFFMRDFQHHFLLSHGLGIKGIALAITALASWGLYEVIRPMSPRLAEIIVSAFIFAPAFWLLTQVVLKNFILGTGWEIR